MAVHELTLQALMDSLDGGRVATAFQTQLRRCIADCEDRPANGKDRVVTMQFKMVPILDEDGFCDEVSGKFHVSSTVPNLRSKACSFGLRKTKKGPQLIFNDLSDGDIQPKDD